MIKRVGPIYIYLDHIKFRNIDDLKKVDRYCRKIFKKPFQEKSIQVINEFIVKTIEQIKEAEKITGKDYLEIEE